MKIYETIEIKENNKKVVTIGNFDGVHLGHCQLLKETVALAKESNMTSCVLSFHPHPRKFFNNDIKYIQSKEDKEKAIAKSGIEIMVHLPFTKDIAECSAKDFVKDILLNRLNADTIVVGYNFTFGKNREGDADTLKELAEQFGSKAMIVPPVFIDEYPVSSSLIRDSYHSGQIEQIKRFTGCYPQSKGVVVKGRQIGRTIGFPTANVSVPADLLLPGRGVYAVTSLIKEKSYSGVANIGTNPTITANHPLSLEVFLFDFAEDIYDEVVQVTFIKKIRDEKKFNSLEELQQAIAIDVDNAKNVLQTMS